MRGVQTRNMCYYLIVVHGILWVVPREDAGAKGLCATSSVNALRGIDTFSIPRRRLFVRNQTL